MAISIVDLKVWGLAASILASHGQKHLSDAILTSMTAGAQESPIGDGDEGVRTMMGYEVAVAWYEGHNQDGQPHGDADGGHSFCWAQINLPGTTRVKLTDDSWAYTYDASGWSGKDLVEDPMKCARMGARMIRDSIRKGPVSCPLCIYARGPFGLPGQSRHTEAQALSNNRSALARKLLQEVQWPPPQTDLLP